MRIVLIEAYPYNCRMSYGVVRSSTSNKCRAPAPEHDAGVHHAASTICRSGVRRKLPPQNKDKINAWQRRTARRLNAPRGNHEATRKGERKKQYEYRKSWGRQLRLLNIDPALFTKIQLKFLTMLRIMVNIEGYLRQNKPEISDSTVSAYTVSELHDRLHGTRGFDDLEWLGYLAVPVASRNRVSYLTQRNT